MKIGRYFYLAKWFFKARFMGCENPLQTVLFISTKCNLQCKHCSVYNNEHPTIMSYEKVCEELRYAHSLGSRFVDFEGGEPTLWSDGDKTLNDLIDYAHSIGFFSCTITTNAQRPFTGSHADSIWVSLDGVDGYHDQIRGTGAFQRLEKNLATANHPHVSVNMVVNSINYPAVEHTLEYVKNSPYLESISINFHTPFPGTEHLRVEPTLKAQILDTVIAYKKKGYPIMNSVSGLRLMKHNNFPKQCWVSNFILPDGTRLKECAGKTAGICDECGFCMAGEMHAVFSFQPDTLLAGLKLRM